MIEKIVENDALIFDFIILFIYFIFFFFDDDLMEI